MFLSTMVSFFFFWSVRTQKLDGFLLNLAGKKSLGRLDSGIGLHRIVDTGFFKGFLNIAT